MKSLKIALMLVVFCLTVSGSSYDAKQESSQNKTFKVDKSSFELSTTFKKSTKNKPSMGA